MSLQSRAEEGVALEEEFTELEVSDRGSFHSLLLDDTLEFWGACRGEDHPLVEVVKLARGHAEEALQLVNNGCNAEVIDVSAGAGEEFLALINESEVG